MVSSLRYSRLYTYELVQNPESWGVKLGPDPQKLGDSYFLGPRLVEGVLCHVVHVCGESVM